MTLFGGKSVSFISDKDIPSLQDKVILVTGSNIGLGKQSILEFAKHSPAQIWLAARNLDKAKVAASDIKKEVPRAPIKLLQLDLASLDSVKKAAKTVLSESDRLDILVLNAGIMAAPPGLTQDGYEIQFQTNYLGHALLAKLLLPLLDKTAKSSPDSDVRIISVSSIGHNLAPKGGLQFDTMRTSGDMLGAYERYGQSKLSQVLWTRYMAHLHPEFTLASVHPGLADTNLTNSSTGSSLPIRTLMKAVHGLGLAPSVKKAVRNQLWASVAKDVKSGEYYGPVGIRGSVSALGKDDQLAKQLWDWTEKKLEKYVDQE